MADQVGETRFRLAIDIGGTFTDAVLLEEQTGQTRIAKVLTTPQDPSEGFLAAVERLRGQVVLKAEQMPSIMHGTTVATNAVLERRGARTAMLLTEGFRDLLEIGRQIRHELYNLQTEKPVPLAPRELCLGIPERIDHQGQVQVALDEESVEQAATFLRDRRINSIGICFLHSYLNPAHERRAAEIIKRVHPVARLSLSSEIAPEIGEYGRASTAAANAYIAPLVSDYLGAIEAKLRGQGISSRVYLMQSSGGLMTLEKAREHPIYILESGPAAGVMAAAYFARLSGYANAISFDMGGTTAKMGLILDGEPKVVPRFEAGGYAGTGAVARGSGYPILAPVMDLVEVGAGGGSIAWVDQGGLLRVGPHSAGALPGPACYGGGGREPTVTDANLTLGRLNPAYFLGGEVRLDSESARAAIAGCAGKLDKSVIDTAHGIVEIANATMAEAMRLVSVQRGLDPREFALVTFGGAGPLHANQLAADLGIPLVLVPPSPGVASAMGMLLSDMRMEYRITRIQPLAELRLEEVHALHEEFSDRARAALAEDGMPAGQIVLQRYLEMRYVGQSWNLAIEVNEEELSHGGLPTLADRFHQRHEKLYGYAPRTEPIEVVNIGLVALGLVPKPKLREVPRGETSPTRAHKGARPVYFRETNGFVSCNVYDRYALCCGNRIPGPAIIEEFDSTTLVHPGYIAEVADYGLLHLRKLQPGGRV